MNDFYHLLELYIEDELLFDKVKKNLSDHRVLRLILFRLKNGKDWYYSAPDFVFSNAPDSLSDVRVLVHDYKG